MNEPAYVRIAGRLARQIRSGAIPQHTQLPSYAELAEQDDVSDIVIRKAIDLLVRQGLVYTIERRGTFVASSPALARVSPERQMEAPETTFGNEAATPGHTQVQRHTSLVPADADGARWFAVAVGHNIQLEVVKATENGAPISISDSYRLPDTDLGAAAFLEEIVADRPAPPAHAAWLGVSTGTLVKTVRQRFLDADDRVLMVSNISYPANRYDSFVFRMALDPQS
jgi:GntR family transcriptional regulator